MTAAETTSAASFVLDCLRITLGYAEKLVKDIPAEQFAHMPHPTMNHPAFCLGHLSLYPNKVLGLLGVEQAPPHRLPHRPNPPGWDELFEMGALCVEQDGRYPSKDEIIGHYTERHRAAAEALKDVSDETLARQNPIEGRFREMCPTVGAAVNFMLNNHQMLHLGQISAWRRAMGLPPVA
jgi:hypothetical protein